jgi:hypothetical protein
MAGQRCPLCSRPIEPGENVAFREATLRRLHCASKEPWTLIFDGRLATRAPRAAA